jgi:putative methylase
VRRAELVRRLERVPSFADPQAKLEQVATPAEAAATLLEAAERWDGLSGRSVVDLGCGTGRLAIGAALLGAAPVVGVDADPAAVRTAREAARAAEVDVTFETAEVGPGLVPAELVVMNPPFGAQRRHADRPFWDAALELARRSVYAFGLAASRTFIARQAVARGARVVEVAPVPWVLGRTFPHHRRRRVDLAVDLWAIRTAEEERGPGAA